MKILTKDDKERYSRQIISPLIGEEGQEKISQIRVLQIGAGGLGSPCAYYLVAAGIKELTIVDNDIVSLSNLQRQILYNETHIGKDKASVAKSVLSRLNSKVEIKTYKDLVDDESIEKYVNNQDFIIDCSDNLKTKFLVNRTALKHKMQCIIAGIKDFYGQIINIKPKKTACYQCIFNEPMEEQENQKPLPVIGVTPGILGTLEALEVIKTALGLPNLENKIMMVNLVELTFNTIDVVKNEECLCSKI
ncbi:MAG: HesA/MoeB/ThiF family protein [Promethearchaeota archaeon]